MKDIRTINWEKGLVPCIVQDYKSKRILMLGYMNQQAYAKTIEENCITFFSRSRNRLWTKGETSGNFLRVVDIRVDCDADAILAVVAPQGPTCHTGATSCFDGRLQFLFELEQTIQQRKLEPTTSSYTSQLFTKGINAIAQKVGEEAIELILEAQGVEKDKFLNEAADLLFHYLVLLNAKGASVQEVSNVLESRSSSSGQ